MPKPKIILHAPHTEVVGSVVERCCNWKLTEPVEGVELGEVGFVPDPALLHCDVVEELRSMAVSAINAAQSTYVFDPDDCITWEID